MRGVVTVALFVSLVALRPAPHAMAQDAPHVGFSSGTSACGMCHKPHAAPSALLLTTSTPDSDVGVTGFCYSCHSGSAQAGARTNVQTGAANSFSLASGHQLATSAASPRDLTHDCDSCHSPHRDYTTAPRLPRPSIVTSSGTHVVSATNDNTWCFACHNDSQDWWCSTTSTAYPSMSSPSRDETQYPVYGTFPGQSVYTSSTANAHSRIPTGTVPDPLVATATVVRGRGDCLWCHAGHRGPSRYDSLLATYSPPATETAALDRTNGDYAAACFACHGGGSWVASGAVDIKQYATKSPDDASATNGHRIKTGGAVLPVNSPLPCYECHNPHGSTRGNKMLIADTLGGSLDATVSSSGQVVTAATQVRKLCFACHASSDGKVWDSGASSYVSVTSDMLFYGLRRDGTLLPGQTRPSGYSLGQNYLRLKALGGGDPHSSSSTKSCYDCHGGTYSGAGSPNVHAPTMGISSGKVSCYGCHSEYQPMEDSIGSVTGGASRLSYYHHVLGSTTYEGDFAPAASSQYPTTVTDVYCVSCHVDHDLFNSNKGANLRTTVASASGTATNTDFIAPGTAGAPGVCVSCHSVARVKQNADQKSSGTTYTVSVDATGYAASQHRYTATATFTASPFRADCVKCHNDTMQKQYQDEGSPLGTLATFGVHLSAEARILASLGGAISNPYEEQFCYKCHSRASDGQGATWTASYQYDRYGVASMSATSVAVYGQMQLSYGHKVQSYSAKHKASPSDETTAYIGQAQSKHIECADCHNPHAAKRGTHTIGGGNGNVAGPALASVWGYAIDTSGLSAWTTPTASRYSLVTSVTYEYQICLKCHTTGTNAALSSWGGTGADAWTDVALEFNPNNASYHPVFAKTTNSAATYSGWMLAQWQNVANQTMTCSDCHGDFSGAAAGPHGSVVKHVLKGRWPLNSSGTPYTLAGDKTGLLCARCHQVSITTGPSVHRNNHHQSQPCYRCHIVVPHGGGLQGLIGDANSNMPSRYAYNNVKSNLFVSAYIGGDGNNRSNCFVTTASGCRGHSNSSASGNW